MQIKICGITNLEDALLAQQLGANAVGFIFYKKSERYISPSNAAEIVSSLSPFFLKVGVFVNSQAKEINRIAAKAKLNLIQLHGDEPPALINEIILPVIKAFRIKNDFDFSSVKNYNCSGYLFDTFSSSQIGGTGRSFDWDLIPKQIMSKSIIAGGITSENLGEVVKINPSGIDVSSSLEIYPGKKDKSKMVDIFLRFIKIGVPLVNNDEPSNAP